MLWILYYSTNNFVRADELSMIGELRLFHEGKSGLEYLWAPYWGHHIVVPRLLMMADEYLFHFSDRPLVLTNIIAQFSSVGLLVIAEWRVLRAAPAWVALFAASATAQLALSSLQMENLSYGMGVQYTVGMLGALGSVALTARAVEKQGALSGRACAGALACAFVCALSIGSGIFLCPVLFAVCFGCALQPRHSPLSSPSGLHLERRTCTATAMRRVALRSERRFVDLSRQSKSHRCSSLALLRTRTSGLASAAVSRVF